MAQEMIVDILALAELEEADRVSGPLDPDPLGFRWQGPVA